MKQLTLIFVIVTIFLNSSCRKIIGSSSSPPNNPLPTTINAVYLLECKFKDSSGFPGIFVTDSVSMRVIIHDTVVSFSNITNFPSRAVPQQIVSGDITIDWVPDVIGILNVTGASGEIAIDFFAHDSSLLGLHFTHTGTHSAQYHRIEAPNIDQYWGGDPDPGVFMNASFAIISTKKQYNNGPPEKTAVEVKMTLQ